MDGFPTRQQLIVDQELLQDEAYDVLIRRQARPETARLANAYTASGNHTRNSAFSGSGPG
ncbi:MAG TPA: hypothetical protein P5149_12080 [Candidatus Competibacteraceae bacterium]|nr:hypothetical protein [Candidatus Competibacteraceae bacterium]